MLAFTRLISFHPYHNTPSRPPQHSVTAFAHQIRIRYHNRRRIKRRNLHIHTFQLMVIPSANGVPYTSAVTVFFSSSTYRQQKHRPIRRVFKLQIRTARGNHCVQRVLYIAGGDAVRPTRNNLYIRFSATHCKALLIPGKCRRPPGRYTRHFRCPLLSAIHFPPYGGPLYRSPNTFPWLDGASGQQPAHLFNIKHTGIRRRVGKRCSR